MQSDLLIAQRGVSTKTLASLVAKMELSKNVAQHLFQETEGNPLFVIETVRTGLLVHDQNSSY